MVQLKREYPYNGNPKLIKHYAQDEKGDFYKIKQEMGLEDYMLDDLRFCNKIDN